MKILSIVALAAAPIALAAAQMTTPVSSAAVPACVAAAPITSRFELTKFTSSLADSLAESPTGRRDEQYSANGSNGGSTVNAFEGAPVARAQPTSLTAVYLEQSCV